MDSRLQEPLGKSRARQQFVAVVVAVFLCSTSVIKLAWGQVSNTSTTTPPSQPAEHPLMPAIRLCGQSVDRLQAVKDYEAVFIKRELLSGQLVTQKMQLRFREQPFSTYMKFIEPYAGREILFVTGQNNNQLLVHVGPNEGLKSFAGTQPLDINSPIVMAENRHPITEIGIKNMLMLVLQQWEIESKYGESNVKFYPDAKLGDVACEVIENSHPVPRRQFKFHLTRLFIDKQSRLPVRVENYGFPQPSQAPPLMEEYTYTNIKVNVDFKDQDFDVRNPSYSF